ncbi:ABC transporter ATP-binding protein [Anaerolineales bacterium HSG24]|nr:ABC transporter ATP-binding protein [Anaerolineales bacterium HSG24]
MARLLLGQVSIDPTMTSSYRLGACILQESQFYPPLDLKETISKNRLIGLWRLIGGFRFIYISAILCLAMATAAKTSTYLLLRYFVDEVLGQPEAPMPYYLIALAFVALAIFEGSFTFLSGRFAARASEGVTLRLRNYMFDHLQRLPVSYHDQAQTGDLVQRCSSDVDALRRFLAEQAIGLGRIVLLFSINFVMLLTINIKLTFMTIIFIPVVIIISLFFFKKVSKAYEEHQEEESAVSTNLQENLSGVRVVKAFARQQFEIDKFEAHNWGQYQKGRQLIKMHAMYWPAVETLSMFQFLLMMYMGALMALNGEMTIGSYMAFIGMAIWIIFPIQSLGRLIVQLSEGMVSYQRVIDILGEKPELVSPDETPIPTLNDAVAVTTVANGYQNGHHDNGSQKNRTYNNLSPTKSVNLTPSTIRGEVMFQNVFLQYGTDTPVLQNISFVVKPGQTVALLGPTGSGKSSLVNLLPRFYNLTSGEIWLDGKPLSQHDLAELRQQIGIVEQEPFLFSRTIRENIAYGVQQKITQAQIETAAKAAAIHDVIMTFPEGYDTLVGEKGVTLSGGQKQRVAIARVLLKSPTILIFDDAVSAVDTETEQLIHEALENLQHGRTTFIIAHRIQTVMQADKILVLDKGRIVQTGTHAELMKEEGIYNEIYDIQSQIDMEIA